MDVGCYGNHVVQTPNIDALAQRGLRCSRAVSNNPVCVPARSILMSGQYSRTCTGSLHNHAPEQPLNRERKRLLESTWPECMRAAGYSTQLIGKWHVDPAPDLLGFDHWFSPLSYGSRAEFLEDGEPTGRLPGFTQDVELQRFGRYCEEQQSLCAEQPFFCYYNIYSPHMPLAEIPFQYQRMFDRKDMPIHANVPSLTVPESWYRCYLWEHADGEGGSWPNSDPVPEGFDLRDLSALYYGAIRWVDDLVGGVLAHLDRCGLRENTIVMFASDHGDNLGSHGVWNKDRFWEESIRIPLLIDDPRAARGLCTDTPVGLVDCMPTLMDLCGIPVPDHVQGRSVAQLCSEDARENSYCQAFVETTTWEICILEGPFKYMCRTDPEPGKGLRPQQRSPDDTTLEFLFNLEADPFEMQNLVGHSEYAGIRQRLREDLFRWDQETPWLNLETGQPELRRSPWRC